MAEREPEQISFDDELRKYIRADPFIPFEVVTTRGDKYEVIDEAAAAVGTSTMGIFLPKTGFQFIRKNQIVAIHLHQTPQP